MTDKTTTGSDAVDLDKLTRYEPEVGSDGYGVRAQMSEYPGCGDYVRFDDVADLIAQARAAAPVKPTISLSRAGAECMSEDECISQDVDFSAYERGVADAIEACENIVGAARAAAPAATAPNLVLDRYDAGLLSDFGGGNVEWWQDYLRAELERAHDYYQTQADGTPLSQQPVQAAVEDDLPPLPEADLWLDPVEYFTAHQMRSYARAALAAQAAPVIAAPTAGEDKQ